MRARAPRKPRYLRWVYRTLSLVCLALWLPYTASAAALRWKAPQGCPDVHALTVEAERVLGEALSAYALSAIGEITDDNGELTLSLSIVLPGTNELPRERVLRADTCQELLEAAAVAIALAAADSARQPPVTSLASATPAAPAATAAVSDGREPAVGLSLDLRADAAFGITPSAGFGVGLRVALNLRALSVGVGATWLPMRMMHSPAGVPTSYGALFGELTLCRAQGLGAITLWGCGVGELGQVTGATRSASTNAPGESHAGLWAAVGLQLGASYALAPPLEVAVTLGGLTPLNKLHFYLNQQQVHQPAIIGGRLNVSLRLVL